MERSKVRRYMESEVREVPSCTQLVENAAHHFDRDDVLDDSDHWIWEVGLAVWEAYEQAHPIRRL